jgi:cytochrome c-type biogenesis protein CcmH
MKRLLKALLCSVFLVAAFIPTARAVTPDEMLKDQALESRAREISQKLRCVVCQNQSIDDSSAPLAKDLRVLVRERLMAGDSDDQVTNFMVARYGNFVLLKPPMQLNTLLLWFGPALLLALALFVLFRTLKAQARLTLVDTAVPLSVDDEKRLVKLLGKRPAS